jgi:arylsulfate sulfotransferase
MEIFRQMRTPFSYLPPRAFGMYNRFRCAVAILPIVASLLTPLHAAITQVNLITSPSAPQLLGTTIQLKASAADSDPGPLSYKWEVQPPGASSFSLMRDFDLQDNFSWTPNYVEGVYQLRLTARDYLAGTSSQQVVTFRVTPLVTGTQAVVIATANPLVALLSAPTCPAGSMMSVVFQAQGSTVPSTTDWRPCHRGSMNFYVAGMAASRTYVMTYRVQTGGIITSGSPVSFTTGIIPKSLSFPAGSVPLAPGPQTDIADSLVLTGYASQPEFSTATDLAANIVWYYPYTVQLTRPVPGGTMLALPSGRGTGTSVWGPNITRQQILVEFDLAGNTIRETNCDRVYEQLIAMGLKDPLGRFNHDAIRLSNGQTMVLGDAQRIFPAGTQGSPDPLDIIGALIVVLDQNFQVLGYWNAFDHLCPGSGCLDINRAGSSQCETNSGQTPGGCPPVLLSSPANDWLHANSLEYLTTDGDLLVSLRNQSWVVKVDYKNATGTGDVLWRLGTSGDFALSGTIGGSYPWFSDQHDVGFVNGGEQILTVFDNGNTRRSQEGGNSRGQVWNIDQAKMLASLQLNADLGSYSPSLGSAQLLPNGDYMFQSGNIKQGATIKVQNTELTPTGTAVYQFQSVGSAPAYRGWRLADFYHATLNGSSGPL